MKHVYVLMTVRERINLKHIYVLMTVREWINTGNIYMLMTACECINIIITVRVVMKATPAYHILFSSAMS